MFQIKRSAIFTQLPIIIGLLLAVSSCEVEDYSPQQNSVDFIIGQSMDLEETILLKAEGGSEQCVYEWYIDEDTKLLGESVSYKFSESGKHIIVLRTLVDGTITGSQQKEIQVFQSSESFLLEANEQVDYCFAVENKIVLHTKGAGSGGRFYVVNSELGTDTILFSLKAVEQFFGSAHLIGDSVLAYQHNQSNDQNFLRLKSTESSELEPRNDLFDFIGGMVYSHKNRDGSLHIDYFDVGNNKVWSRDFNETNRFNNVYNLNGYLYYLSVDQTAGTIFVEKFKNPSVIFNSNTYKLGTNNGQLELLFVTEDTYAEKLHLAVYNHITQYTLLYAIDNNCDLQLLAEYPGRVNATHIELSRAGDFLSFENNRLVKYNAEWVKLATMSFENTNSGFTQLADNLVFCYQVNSDNSLKMFFVDKHLKRVKM